MKVINFIGQGGGGGGWHESNTFNRPKYFFSIKIRCQQKVMCLVGGNVGFILCGKNVFGFWLDVKEETAASND